MNPKDREKETWIGHDDPDLERFMNMLEPWFISMRGVTLSPPQLQTVYLFLVRLSDLNTFGYQRNWEAIAHYCPRTDDTICDRCGTICTLHDGPNDGWQVESGETICQECCVKDLRKIAHIAKGGGL